MEKILVLNLGGTSSKVAVFYDDKKKCGTNIAHAHEDMQQYKTINEQVGYRTELIREWLDSVGEQISDLTAIAVRGGGLADFYAGGTYLLEGKLLQACLARFGDEETFVHGTQLVVRIALRLMGEKAIPIFLTDPTTVDEKTPEARLGGHPQFKNTSVFHALNSKVVARCVAGELGKDYEESSWIVAHLGAGTSVSAHKNGKVIDVNNCLEGDGPMSPNRSGTLQTGQLVRLCFSGKYTEQEVISMLRKNGGMKAYLGTDDVREIEKQAGEGNEAAKLVIEAYILQVAKEIGLRSAILDFCPDGIILTGGVAHSKYISESICQKVKRIANVYVKAGEMENEGLAKGALRVLQGKEKPVVYDFKDGQ